jgi:hypothetical protein
VKSHMQTSRLGGERDSKRLDVLAFHVPNYREAQQAYLEPNRTLLAILCRNYKGVGQKRRGEGSVLAQKTAKPMLKLYKGGL